MGIWYCTREEVQESLLEGYNSRSVSLIDRRIEASSRGIEETTLHRRFYPEIRTVSFDWPDFLIQEPTWELDLGRHEMVSVTSVVSGGDTIDPSKYFLRRRDALDEPPYTHLELDLGTNAAFSIGSTHQKSLVVTGLFCYKIDEEPTALLATSCNSTTTNLTVKPNSGLFGIGVGSLIRIGTERINVTHRSMTTTSQTLQSALTDSQSDTAVSVTDGTAYAVGEIILLDSERMRIEDIAGNTLIVERAADGSVLASHTGSTIYARRLLTVERGVLGTTAASHDADDTIEVFRFPQLVTELAIAETVNMLENRLAGYARTVGTGDNQRESTGRGVVELRKLAFLAHGRNKVRAGAV